MRLFFAISCFVCFCFLLGISNHQKIHDIGMVECVEDGICKQGLIIKHNGSEIFINKEFCLSQNGKWIKDIPACYFR